MSKGFEVRILKWKGVQRGKNYKPDGNYEIVWVSKLVEFRSGGDLKLNSSETGEGNSEIGQDSEVDLMFSLSTPVSS